jgi:hypothetical protein
MLKAYYSNTIYVLINHITLCYVILFTYDLYNYCLTSSVYYIAPYGRMISE